MENAHTLPSNKIALLIDFDNVILGIEDPGFDVELVVNAMRSRGVVVLGRAYGDWYRHHRHRRKLMEQGIELVETPVFGPVIKNSADIRIVLDGFEIAMSQGHIDTFCLVSGDSDFLPLIKKLQYLGKNVIVIAGQKFTSELVRRNCNEYIAYENLFAERLGATEDLSVIEGAYALLDRAINTLNERLMDVRSSTVKQMMLQLNPAFNERAYGFNQFKGFLDRATRANVVKLGERDHVSGEYSVFLANEREETAGGEAGESARREPRAEASRTGASRTETATKGPRRFSGRGRRGGAEGETPTETAAVAESAETAAPVEPAAKPNQSPIDAEPVVAPVVNVLAARTNLRRGRLRFSAKSGLGSVATAASTTSAGTEPTAGAEPMIAPPDANELNIALLPTDISGDVAISEPAEEESTDETTSVEAAPTEAKTARKRGSRGGRRQKKTGDEPAGEKSEVGEVAATVETSLPFGEEPDTPAPATNAGAEAGEAVAKPARARRPAARRAPRTKKPAENPAESGGGGE